MGTLWFILGILLFIGLIVLHELGHALAARRNKVEVEEFGIGFPPRAWGKKLKNGTLFSLNWLPLGGFVKLKGEHDSAHGPGTYGGASLWAKTKILMAGVAVNWLTAAAIFTILALVGIPKVLENQFAVAGDNQVTTTAVRVSSIKDDSPAGKAGLAAGDPINSLNNQPITSANRLRELTAENAGKTVPITYTHGGQTKESQVTLNKEAVNGQGYLGVGPLEETTQRATWSAPIVGVGLTVQLTYESFKGIFMIFAQLFQGQFSQAGSGVTGTLGVLDILKSSSEFGIVPVLLLVGLISLSLAVMNVLPIPALDGGRLFVTLLFKALKKPLTKQREEAIQAAGFLCLMGLVVVITILDVTRIF